MRITVRELQRSRKHQLFLATYISVGLSFALVFALAVRDGKLVVSTDGIRAFPFLIAFFVISGFLAMCQFPAELSANRVFRLTAAEWTEAARRAIRKQTVTGGLIPMLVLMMPLEFMAWDWPEALLQIAFQLSTRSRSLARTLPALILMASPKARVEGASQR